MSKLKGGHCTLKSKVTKQRKAIFLLDEAVFYESPTSEKDFVGEPLWILPACSLVSIRSPFCDPPILDVSPFSPPLNVSRGLPRQQCTKMTAWHRTFEHLVQFCGGGVLFPCVDVLCARPHSRRVRITSASWSAATNSTVACTAASSHVTVATVNRAGNPVSHIQLYLITFTFFVSSFWTVIWLYLVWM